MFVHLCDPACGTVLGKTQQVSVVLPGQAGERTSAACCPPAPERAHGAAAHSQGKGQTWSG